MTTYATGNPIGSTEVKDLFDNAQNLDNFINNRGVPVFADRLGVPRKTWAGIEAQAQLDIAAAVAEGTAQAEAARDAAEVAQIASESARDDAVAAAGAIGPLQFFSTYADAEAALPGLAEDSLIEVSQDETRGNARTRYRVTSAALVFEANLDLLRIYTTGALTPSPAWPDVPGIESASGLSDPALNAQAQALLDRTQWARDTLEDDTDPSRGPGILTVNPALDYPIGSVGAAILTRDLPELRVSQALTTAQLRSSIETELDITSALISLVNTSKATGFRGILIDVPKAKITAPLPQLNVSFDFVKLRGLGQGKTQLNVSTAGHTPFVYRGGSGGHAGTVIEGMSIDGADDQDIFLNQGFCGADVVDCKINGRVIGVLSNDIGVGTFTEFFRLVRCNITCAALFTMQRGAGNDSFHGCGWPGSIVNQRASGAFLVQLGAAADTGRAVWYNGEIDSTIFPRQSTGALFANGNAEFAATSFISTTGALRTEYFGSGAPVVSSVFSHIHSGGYFELTAGAIKMGTMRPASSGGFSVSTVPAYTMTEGRASKQTVNTTSAIIEGADYGCGRLLFVWVQGGNYEYLQLVACAGRISGGIAPSVVVVATLRQFDVAGWGPPSYVMGDTALTVSGPWAGAVSVQVSELPGTFKPF